MSFSCTELFVSRSIIVLIIVCFVIFVSLFFGIKCVGHHFSSHSSFISLQNLFISFAVHLYNTKLKVKLSRNYFKLQYNHTFNFFRQLHFRLRLFLTTCFHSLIVALHTFARAGVEMILVKLQTLLSGDKSYVIKINCYKTTFAKMAQNNAL